MGSLWTQHMEMPEFGELRKDIRTQVLIIGGGMTGILCAYFLEQAGVDYCLLEKGRICMEATAHTLGMVTAQPGLMYEKALQRLGQEQAGLFLEANRKAVENYRNLGNFVDCDMEEKEFLLYSIKDRRKLESEMQALGSLGVTAEYMEQTALPFEVMGALHFPGQLALHPLKFASGLVRNLRIYENSEVKEMTEYFCADGKRLRRGGKNHCGNEKSNCDIARGLLGETWLCEGIYDCGGLCPEALRHVSEYRQGRDFFFLLQESVAAYDRRAEKRTCRGGVGAAAQIRPGILSGGARALFLEK